MVVMWFPLLPLPSALTLEADANIADHAILHVPRLQIHVLVLYSGVMASGSVLHYIM